MNEERNHDEIATLIRLAGRRTPVSEERAARVREAVHAEWLKAARQRTRIRLFAAAAAMAAVVFAGRLVQQTTRIAPVPAAAQVRVFRTEAGFASLDWNGVALRLDKATQIRIVSAQALILDRGALYFDGDHARREVRTRFGTVRDVGTRFEVRTGDVLHVRVRDGRVDFRGEAVDAGTELIVRGAAPERAMGCR